METPTGGPSSTLAIRVANALTLAGALAIERQATKMALPHFAFVLSTRLPQSPRAPRNDGVGNLRRTSVFLLLQKTIAQPTHATDPAITISNLAFHVRLYFRMRQD